MGKTRVIILGAIGNCLDILDLMAAINQGRRKDVFLCDGFLDDNPSLWGQTLCGKPVLGPLNTALDYKDCFFVNGIGSPSSYLQKKDIIGKTGIPDERFISLVHPFASVSAFATLGTGTVLLSNVMIGANVNIGSHVMVLPNAVVNHDVRLGDYCCVGSGVSISGNVTIGESCYLGGNSSVIGDITLGDRTLVGLGSVVLKDVGDNCVVAGNPARLLV